MSKTDLFQTIRFVNLGAMSMKGYSAFFLSSDITGASPSDCSVLFPGHLLVEVLLLCREAVGISCSLRRLGDLIYVNFFVEVKDCVRPATLLISTDRMNRITIYHRVSFMSSLFFFGILPNPNS